jgi:uncharacterized phage protein (predicted DNA packaging)
MPTVQLEKAKAYLRIDHSGEDSAIMSMVGSSEAYIRGLCKPFVDEFGDLDVLPPEVEQAVLLLTSHFYSQRGAVTERNTPHEVPFTISALIASHRAGTP